MVVGPGGYVAAIKAAQLGLKVSGSYLLILTITNGFQDCLYRETWFAWWNMFERRMHTVEGHA